MPRKQRLCILLAAVYSASLRMDYQRRSEINRFADAVRAYIGLSGPPFDMADAIHRLDGTLVELDEVEASRRGEASVCKVGDSFEVRVGPAAETRRRFSIAHELGHLFLHMGFRVDADKWNNCREFDEMNRQGTSDEEYEAHEFAGALLMPELAFKDVANRLRNDGVYETDKIAAHFGVSVHAATTRGRWLGLFSWT